MLGRGEWGHRSLPSSILEGLYLYLGAVQYRLRRQAELLSQASVPVLCAYLTAILKHRTKQYKVRRVYSGLQFYRLSLSHWKRDDFRGRRQRVPLDATRSQGVSRKLGLAVKLHSLFQ